MRLFVAVYPSAEALDDLDAHVSTLGLARYAAANDRNVRLTARELWHVTLAFLGETPVERVDRVMGALDTAATQATQPAPGTQLTAMPATLRVGGGGKFGRGRFTILWAGLRGDVDALGRLAASVRVRLRKARAPYDHKPFRPHLTIARPGDRVPVALVAADVMALGAYDGPRWACDEICLVSSQPGPHPVHHVIHRATIMDRGA